MKEELFERCKELSRVTLRIREIGRIVSANKCTQYAKFEHDTGYSEDKCSYVHWMALKEGSAVPSDEEICDGCKVVIPLLPERADLKRVKSKLVSRIAKLAGRL